MRLELRAVAENIRRADTETLLDRVTVFRGDMEPAALDLIEGELSRRGTTPEEIEEYAARRARDVVFRDDGTARVCSFCERPAVVRGLGWHKLWGLVPVFPRVLNRCDHHGPHRNPSDTAGGR